MAERKRRRRHTGLVAAALVLAAVAAVAVWQRNNIAAVLTFLSAGSQEEIEQRLQQNQQTITDAVEKNPEIVVRDVTEEEKQALRDGTLTQEELAGRLVGEQTAQPQEEPPEQETPKQEQPEAEPGAPDEQTEQPAAEPGAQDGQKVESAYQEQVSAVVAKAYVLREKFTIALDSMKDEAAAEYRAIPEAERTSGRLTEFAKKYVARATALEKQCDAEMDTIVEELTALVTANNGELSIVDTMIETYAREKSLKKAWYLAELKERGLTL